MPVSTCLRSNIHKNGPQILGINLRTEVILIQCQKNMSKNNKKEKKRNEEEVHLH
jgi:hypothetical protein